MDFERFKLLSNVLIGVTTVADVTAALTAIFTHRRGKQRKKSRLSISPTLVPGGAGLTMRGHY